MGDSTEDLSDSGAAMGLDPGQSEVIGLRSRGEREKPEVSSSRCDEAPLSPQSRLLSLLSCDLLACDVQLSLFVAAATTYRLDSSLAPFPPMYYTSSGGKDVQGLQDAIKEIPPLTCLKRQLEQTNCQLSPKLLQLLTWVLTGGQSQLSLRTVPRAERDAKLSLVAGTSHLPEAVRPTLVLEVRTANTDRWLERNQETEQFYGFHGSRLDNWHSILHHGLQQHRAKNSLFGEGIYLSCDLGVCLPYGSRGVHGWAGSQLGAALSCVALATICHHPSVKIHTADPERGQVEGSEGGKVPEKYIVVRNNDLLNIRYLLVYGHAPPVTAAPLRQRSALVTWIHQNKMVCLLLGYGLMLLAVGVSNSVWVRRFLRKRGFID